MKNLLISIIFISSILLYSCDSSKSKDLSAGDASRLWQMQGSATLDNEVLTLSGSKSQAILKNSNYQDFDLNMEVRTSENGKGFIGFHTDVSTEKGYRVAINNDMGDPIWWRMTGSLMSVRNLTKSFVKEGEWFKMNIRVEGQSIAIYINDQPVVEYLEPSKPFRLAANTNTILSQGTFSLVSTGAGIIEFRNINVEALNRKDINIPAQLEVALDEQSDEIIRLHQEDFPVLDYHVHLKGGLTKEAAIKQSRRVGINYAVAPNCGIGFQITNDQEIFAYLDTMRSQPFILAMQGEGREWVTTFSQKARDEFDFVFTDALTFNDYKNRRVRLWINKEVIIDDEQKYMDMIVDKTCSVLQEPADIFVNPFFLPDALNNRYDELWTEKRINKVIDVLAKSGKALEINELYQIPSKAILMKAKAAGIKFTFGSNNVTPEVSTLAYSVRMKKECELTQQDMYKPKIKIE